MSGLQGLQLQYLLCLSTLTNPTQCCRMLPRPRLSLCLPQFLRKAVWLKTTGVMNHVWRRRWKVPHALPRVNLAILVYHAWNKHSKLSWCAPSGENACAPKQHTYGPLLPCCTMEVSNRQREVVVCRWGLPQITSRHRLIFKFLLLQLLTMPCGQEKGGRTSSLSGHWHGIDQCDMTSSDFNKMPFTWIKHDQTGTVDLPILSNIGMRYKKLWSESGFLLSLAKMGDACQYDENTT